MRSGAPILCLAVAALIAGAPAAWSAGSEHKADAHAKDTLAKDAHEKKYKPGAPEHGKEAPPARTGCYYNPNAPLQPVASEQPGHSAPDVHGGSGKAEHPAAPPLAAEQAKAEHPLAAEQPPAPAQPHTPDAHGGEVKAEHPAAAPAEHGGAAAEAAPPGTPAVQAAASPPVGPIVRKDEAEQPYMLIRTLESVQDKIASGSRDAHLYQRELIAEIAKKLPRVTDEEWKQPRNSRGAIIYALSGGDPGVLAKLLSLSPVPCIDDNLVKGLLDYSQGRNPEALALLSKIDARTLDPRAGGHLALAQAMLVATDDPKRAIAYLDMARLLAPGTLVEEAALRREAIVAAGAEDLDKFKLLTSQYLRRYHKSFYAGDFIRRFAVVMMTGKYAESPALFQELAETLDTLDKEQQKLVYSAIAEAGIVRGRVQITLLAAKKLADQAKDDPKRSVQARLYESAVLLVTDEYDRAAAQLKSIDRAALAPRDQPLLDAALTVASRMRAAPEAAASDAPPPPVSAEQGKDAELSQLPAVVGRANKAIVRVDELLDGDKR
jgi:chemotaxis protein MotC